VVDNRRQLSHIRFFGPPDISAIIRAHRSMHRAPLCTEVISMLCACAIRYSTTLCDHRHTAGHTGNCTRMSVYPSVPFLFLMHKPQVTENLKLMRQLRVSDVTDECFENSDVKGRSHKVAQYSD